MRHVLGWQILALMLAPAWALADDPIEELPPPKAEASALVPSKHADREPHPLGWGLVGPSGRHYFVGSEALADYLRGGQRHIVALGPEVPGSHSAKDPNFLYYRESSERRWAFGRQPSADGSYRVYFQDASTPGVWTLFQRARATWDNLSPDLSADEPAAVLSWDERGCGH